MFIDFNGVDMQGFKVLENADYIFDIVNVEYGRSESGNNRFKVTLRGRDSRAQVYDYFVVSPDHLSKLKTFLSYISEPCEGSVDVDMYRWVGKSVKARTKKEKYNGNDQNKIHYYIGPEHGEAARQQAAQNSAASAPRTPPATSSYEETQDDMPF